MSNSPLQTQTRKIGDCEYEVTQLNAVKARRVFLKFTQVAAPALRDLADFKKGIGEIKAEEILTTLGPAIAGAFSKLVENVSSDDLDFFVDQFAAATCVVSEDPNTGKRLRPKLSEVIGLHFVGDRFLDQFHWLAFCFEVNFGSFFRGLGLRPNDSQADPAALK